MRYKEISEEEVIELGKALAEEFVKNGLVSYVNGFNGVTINNEQAVDAIVEWCKSEDKTFIDWMNEEDREMFYLDDDLCLYDRESLLAEIMALFYSSEVITIRCVL